MEDSKYSRLVFYFLILSMLPTIVMGILKISTYTNTVIWVWDVLMIILLVVYCFFKRYKIYKKSFNLILIFLLVIIFQIIDYSNLLSNGSINKLYTILPFVYFAHFLCSYVMIGDQNKIVNWKKFFEMFVYFAIICCIYNVVINVKNFPKVLAFNNKYIGFSSFFNHRNGFGQLLFIAIVSNTYVLSYNKERKFVLTFLFLMMNLILTFSRTSILSTFVFFFICFLQNLFAKKDKKSIFLGFTLIILVGILVMVGINNEKIINFANYYIFRSEDGLSGRDTIWKIAISNIKGTEWLTGHGIGTTSQLLEKYGLTNSHNSIIEIVLTGGITFLLFYIIIITSIFKNIVKFQDYKLKMIYTSFFIAFFTYIMFEKVLLFSTGYAPIMFTIFLIIIPKLTKKRDEKNE